jgi:phosphatidate phosphatase APP1
MVPAANVQGVISDFDDTVVISEVNRFFRLLGHSLLRNPQQREPVPGMADAYARLIGSNPQAGAAPLFYLSASPRQLQASIQSFLDYNGFPRGVLITKRVTNDDTSDPLRDQVRYKTEKLVDIFERLPTVRFTLIGDDGEQDPEIYRALQQRYPERVAAIWIRRVHPDPRRVRIEGQGDVADLLKQ